MVKKHKISEFREKLDNTLALDDLVDEVSVRSLVKDQLLRSSFINDGDIDKVVGKRASDVSHFLGMLRSASGNKAYQDMTHEASHSEWKIKQDTDDLRVMYREGPQGTPFHILLAEGFADGPIDVCVCVSFESTLYSKWWPQFRIPTFKIINSTSLQKVCIGEQISLIRVKVPWPISDREAILHYYEVEYFKEDLVVVLINTISDTEDIDISTHGFGREGIPQAKDTIRIDLVGGYVLQKIDAKRSYFRVIVNMDIKLDFVPPSLINFISRQLIGSGYKLYQKAVGSVGSSDEDYRQALQGPLYVRIRESMESKNKHNGLLLRSDKEKSESNAAPQHRDNNVTAFVDITPVSEIVEQEVEQNTKPSISSTNSIPISPDVVNALRTLDHAIAIVRGRHNVDSGSFSINEDFGSITSDQDVRKSNLGSDTVYKEEASGAKDFRNIDKSSVTKEASYGQQEASISFSKSREEATFTISQAPVTESMSKVCDETNLVAKNNGEMDHHRNRANKEKKKKQCCLNLRLF